MHEIIWYHTAGPGNTLPEIFTDDIGPFQQTMHNSHSAHARGHRRLQNSISISATSSIIHTIIISYASACDLVTLGYVNYSLKESSKGLNDNTCFA